MRRAAALLLGLLAVGCGDDKPDPAGAGGRGGSPHAPGLRDPDGGADGLPILDAAPPDAAPPPDAPGRVTCGMSGPEVASIDLTGQQGGFVPGATSAFSGSCGGGEAGELVFSLEVDRPLAALKFRVLESNTSAEVALYVRATCADADSEVACQTGRAAEVTVPNPMMGQRYYVFVDGARRGEMRGFQLVADGTLPDGAACDAMAGAFRCGEGLLCGAAMGGSVCRRPACSDTMDNDGDGKADYPMEPGCADALDDDEMDPAMPPVCADGMDNDMDGRADYPMDTECPSAAGDSEEPQCGAGVVIEDITATGMVTANTQGGSAMFTPSCGFSQMTTPERIYVYRHSATMGQGLRITTEFPETTYDSIVYVRRDDCTSMMDVACDDDGGDTPSLSSRVEIANAPAGRYFIFVDGAGTGSGPFKLAVTSF